VTAFSPACPSCGGKGAVRREGRFFCSFCGSLIERRLVPGTLCEEDRGAAACGQLARSLCRGCSRPLCDTHDDPKSLYWGAPLGWERLFARWSAATAIAWSRAQAPLQHFPLADVPPDFPWVNHEQESSYAVGGIEDEIRSDLQALAQTWGAEVGELACTVDSVCAACAEDMSRRLEERVDAHAERYRQVAYLDRMDALEGELRQRLRYVEAHLRRAVHARPPSAAAPSDDAEIEVGAGSLPVDWDRCGWSLQERLRDLEQVRAASRVSS
jgi:hypothetical protein